LNLLKKDKTYKVGLKTKAKACSWDHQYLLNILTQSYMQLPWRPVRMHLTDVTPSDNMLS